MIQSRRGSSWRSLVGLALGVWLVLLAFSSVRAATAGPEWGVRLGSLTFDGRVQVVTIAANSLTANDKVRPGDEVVSVDGTDPQPFAGQDVPGWVREIVFRDMDGAPITVRYTEISQSLLALLWSGALVFALIGGIVYRWSADAALGRVFLALTASFASALAVVPAARLGDPFALFVAPGAALVACASLLVLFLMFPRRMRWVRPITLASFALSGVLFASQVAELALPRSTADAIDTAAWLWSCINLLGALVVLGLRARHGRDRAALAPLFVGTVVAVGPMIVLAGVPRFFGFPPLVAPEVAAIAMAAIPIAFAYSILRNQIFGLDVLMRRIILRLGGVVIGVALFMVAWLALSALGLPDTSAAFIAVCACCLCLPSITSWTSARLDAWLYRSLATVNSTPVLADGDGLEELGTAVTVRVRRLLPVQWAAVLVHDDTTPVDAASRRVLGADGQLQRWLDPSSALDQSPTEVSVTPLHRFDNGVVLLLSGPRLDGGSLDGIQFETLRQLAHHVAPSFEAALLRERAEEEATFRQGLTDLARDLAAAATVSDVLRVFSTHAVRLLQADSAKLIWPGRETAAAVAQDAEDDSANVLTFDLETDSAEPLACYVRRASSTARFGAREERRARELAEHTTGALRRAAEREILEEQLRHRAFYDSLTGLPNRALFLDRIGHAQARAERAGQELAVLFIDLDRFKVVNDSLGHLAGDQLLLHVAQRLRSSLRESDTIARLGGDEFTVLLEGPTALSDAVHAAERILATLRDPLVLDGQETYASASIGIAGGSAVREAGRDLLREADIALYRAKANRGRYTVYDPRMSQLPSDYLHLESDLHRAIQRGELRVHYQPIFSLNSSEITGLEALLRWEHPDKGLVAPGQFIPLAEDTGLIVPIGKWVLQEACRQVRQWQTEHSSLRKLTVSVNLSARQLQDALLIDDVKQTLESSRIDPRQLQLEITESVVMQDPEAMVVKLEALKSLGIKLAVDDFGTGYSSLAYLKRFPIDVLKIDRAFVSGLAHGGQDSAIVQTVIGLARALGLSTTAEGIEERSQWDRLEQLGCDQGQGFIFSRPLRPEAARELLLSNAKQALQVAA